MRFEETTAVITGIGAGLPEQVLDNAAVIEAGRLRTTDEWIRTRTGIAHRRRVAPGISTGDLAVAAGRGAISSDGGSAPDLLVLATSTPDQPCPATAPYVAHRLGLGTVPAFDVGAVCSGFLYALTTATALLHSGLCRAPLVVGADTYSTIVDPTDRDTAALFGDGAGAVLLRPGRIDAPGAVVAAALGADGSGHQLIAVPGGGSRQPMHLPQLDPKGTTFQMQGREVYAHAVRRMVASAREALDRAGWPAETVEAFIGHQANQRILDAVAGRLGIDPEHRFGNIRDVGNTAAASIPLVMADPVTHGALTSGRRTLLTAFGGGLTWASVALNWPAAVPRTRSPSPELDLTPLSSTDLLRSHAWTPSASTSPPS
ncbi:beta-ketoacyl-ACP synthase III [Kitasatospora sp. CMC57]|uniref:Beta-ketoacyl-ACP synthase III n=1 Tax=Kitasatospora sp. CMC57 TaxID=3231513 RepID=A0AB33K9N7_9ACTN